MKNFEKNFESFVSGCQYIIDNANLSTKPVLSVEPGRRYMKLVCRDSVHSTAGRVFAFVDKTNGDVLKPATWKAPAKHARGNIYDEANGLKHVNWTGPAYLAGM